MLLIFVHGWSVTHTKTYGGLPKAIAMEAKERGLDLEIDYLWLGKYVSFRDEVGMDDLARAFDYAIREQFPGACDGVREFSCVTHSTGGPLVRQWLDRYYGTPQRVREAPLKHLIMLAPANHGSALACLGKARVGRVHAWFQGQEPGQRILDWLSLGSTEQHTLCSSFLTYWNDKCGVYPYVLTGQGIDEKFYDFINPYLVEKGSDGVIRVAAANLNYTMVKLIEGNGQPRSRTHDGKRIQVMPLELSGEVRRPVSPIPLGVVPNASHSGKKMGIMQSVTSETWHKKEVVSEIVQCLKVTDVDGYHSRVKALNELTEQVQQTDRRGEKKIARYVMLVFRIFDNLDNPVEDYDLLLLGRMVGDPGSLPPGFFVDRQLNKSHPNILIYYLDYDNLETVGHGVLGLRLIARPDSNRRHLVYYRPVEYLTEGIGLLQGVVVPNQTVYIDIVIKRHVDKRTFRLEPATGMPHSFRETWGSSLASDEVD